MSSVKIQQWELPSIAIRVPGEEGGQRSGRKSSAGGKVRHRHILKKQSPYSFAPARLRSAFSRRSVKKWYVFGSCFNLSTPYPDFPRKQASKEARSCLCQASGLWLPASSDPTSQPHRTSQGAVFQSGHCKGCGAKFWSDSLHIWLPLGSGVRPQGLSGSTRQRRWAAAACKLSKEPASAAASSCRCGVGSTASPFRCHAASSAAPPPPPRAAPALTLLFAWLTRTEREGGEGVGPPTPSPPARGGTFSASLVTRLRPSPPRSLRIGGRRTSGARRAEWLRRSPAPHLSLHPPLQRPPTSPHPPLHFPRPVRGSVLRRLIGPGAKPAAYGAASWLADAHARRSGGICHSPLAPLRSPPPQRLALSVASSPPGSSSAPFPRLSPPHLPCPAGRGLLYDSVKSVSHCTTHQSN